MQSFKVGDLVKLVKFSSNDNIGSLYFDIGQIMKVKRVDEYSDRVYVMCPPRAGTGNDWYIPFECVKKANKPVTEIDFLDAFKDNFREGV
jgi:hypothetical protein